ncbi:MAG: DUF4157 domain-containing protein [Solirubrobacteraceae bacterium]
MPRLSCRGDCSCEDCVSRSLAQTAAAPGPAFTGALPSRIATEFGSRFGRDFSGVQVHADAAVARSASALNASAHTIGQDIAFAAGQYQPDTPAGRGLLAHELAALLAAVSRGSLSPERLRRQDLRQSGRQPRRVEVLGGA